MAGRVRFSRRAREDLLDIWTFIAPRDLQAADLALDRIAASCGVLADHPRLGRARPEIGDGARTLVVGRWLALYRLTDDGVQVVRVVDGARDLRQIAWPADDA